MKVFLQPPKVEAGFVGIELAEVVSSAHVLVFPSRTRRNELV